mmetsp:Transcript_12916/g.6385  ORF Transcript_12916/g.6385 Transcript_12916/m.6385 type:complete len:101 (+) Transcript_12916:76-378(+)
MSNDIYQVELNIPIVKISAGGIFSACVGSNGKVYTWGNGELGQLGLGRDIRQMPFATEVSNLQNDFVYDLVCGETHVIVLCTNGSIFGWGQGVAGKFSKS